MEYVIDIDQVRHDAEVRPIVNFTITTRVWCSLTAFCLCFWAGVIFGLVRLFG